GSAGRSREPEPGPAHDDSGNASRGEPDLVHAQGRAFAPDWPARRRQAGHGYRGHSGEPGTIARLRRRAGIADGAAWTSGLLLWTRGGRLASRPASARFTLG